MSKPFRIAIAGLGTVGAGVVKLIQQNGSLLASRAGRPLDIVAVCARDWKRDRGVKLDSYQWMDQPEKLLDVPGVDAVVELIGGSEGPARALVEKALGRGISVVTANKALLAHHGYELAALAESKNAALRYEGAVAAGIPIIKSLREGFSANRINAVYGILNGTCNYILTEMRVTGRDFADVLADAQKKGYAEADPTFDVDGIDAAHKLSILSALAFGIKPDYEALTVQGISRVSAQDIFHAQELGYRIKLLGITRRLDDTIVQSVEPCLVPEDRPISAVEGVYNAVFVESDFAGIGLSVGRGAGAGPTASAVVADLVDLARGLDLPTFGIPAQALKSAARGNAGDIVKRFYVHLIVLDQPGVLADTSAILRDHNVSLEAVMQRGRDPGNPVSIVLTTHKTRQADIQAAIARIEALAAIAAPPCLMRIEDF